MLPYALKCGMTADEFWYGEPRLLSSYIKKYEQELDEINYESWLIGLYVYKAISTALGDAFSSKNNINNKYFDKPLEELNSNYIEEHKEKLDKKDTEYRNNVNYWAKFGKKGA